MRRRRSAALGVMRLAEDLRPAGGGPVQPEDEAQERGLAGAVGPEQTEHAARLDGERHVVERDLAVLVDLGEVLRLDDQFGVVASATGLSQRELRDAPITAAD